MNDLVRAVIAPAEMRAESDDDGRVLSGYAAVFNSPADLGLFTERVLPGAFADSVAGDVRLLWNHDASAPLARTISGTLSLAEDSRGLKFTARLGSSALASFAHEAIERGDVSQMSFGFRVLEQVWRDDGDQVERDLVRVELLEISPVSFPAYAATQVDARAEARVAFDAFQAERGARASAAQSVRRMRLRLAESL